MGFKRGVTSHIVHNPFCELSLALRSLLHFETGDRSDLELRQRSNASPTNRSRDALGQLVVLASSPFLW